MNQACREIDEVFAAECDADLCDAIYYVLCEREAVMPEFDFSGWPSAWVVHWSVWRHYGSWKVDGFESLWMVGLEQLTQFQQCLIEIGDHGASELLSKSLQAVGIDRIGAEHLAFSDDVHNLAMDWDKEAEADWWKVESCLAKYTRARRQEFSPLHDELVAR
ncbi:MAG: hypothetical protein JNG86_16525, partial [Verrucomicrobiaceae bacterium]|nr:hypothetical protein [Verrucomicrobiaceae bacterium]